MTQPEQVDLAKLEALRKQLERGELREEDRAEVVRLLKLLLSIKDALSSPLASMRRIRNLVQVVGEVPSEEAQEPSVTEAEDEASEPARRLTRGQRRRAERARR